MLADDVKQIFVEEEEDAKRGRPVFWGCLRAKWSKDDGLGFFFWFLTQVFFIRDNLVRCVYFLDTKCEYLYSNENSNFSWETSVLCYI